jgi:signal peptidase I
MQKSSRNKKDTQNKSVIGVIRDCIVILLAAIILFSGIRFFVFQTFEIPSGSMEDTLQVGDKVLASRFQPMFFNVHRGDIVVFHDSGDWLGPKPKRNLFDKVALNLGMSIGSGSDYEFLIKRVIGLPGEVISCDGGSAPIKVNGHALVEPYIKSGTHPSIGKFTVTVPPNMVWVMGDNRDNSADSRYHMDSSTHGAVPIKAIVGVAVFKIWPYNSIQKLNNPFGNNNTVK